MKIIINAIIIASFSVIQLFGNTYAANFPLQITQPQPGLSTVNRFYKAYPGLMYNVRLAVIGGAYPYNSTLTQAPSGMTVNGRTGEISWPNPIASATPYPVSVKVVDKENNTQSISWTIMDNYGH